MKKLILTLIIITSLNLATITNETTINIGEGITLRSNGDFINNGYLNFDDGSTFRCDGNFTNQEKLF